MWVYICVCYVCIIVLREYVFCVFWFVCVCSIRAWCVYACMSVYVCVYLRVCVCLCMCVCEWVCRYEYMCIYRWVCVSVETPRLVYVIQTWWREIRICARYGPDTLVIRRPIHKMIRRSASVRAVKTRRRFGAKTASFHVSVCSCIILLFIIFNSIYMLLVSFPMTIWFILSVWLCVSFHEISMSLHFNYVIDMSVYRCHFMC